MIVDDHPVFRAGLSGLVNLEPDLSVCGEAQDGATTLAFLEKRMPDVVLMDMSLPGKSGLDLIKDLRAIYPSVKVLVISMHDERLYAERVIRSGGRGYIMKQEGPEKVIAAIRKVLSGGIAVSEQTASHLLDVMAGTHAIHSSLAALSDRELDVYRLLGSGVEPHEIARKLHLSIKTVDTHRLNIRRKLGLRNATELVHHATRWAAGQA